MWYTFSFDFLSTYDPRLEPKPTSEEIAIVLTEALDRLNIEVKYISNEKVVIKDEQVP